MSTEREMAMKTVKDLGLKKKYNYSGTTYKKNSNAEHKISKNYDTIAKETEIKHERRIPAVKKDVNKVSIGTWNITSLNGKEIEITEEMSRFKIDILGISEVKKQGKGNIKLTNEYTLYYSGTDPGQRNKEGVGIIMADRLNRRVIKAETINSRIIAIEVDLGQIFYIIQIYAPVEGAEVNMTEEFYEELQREIDRAKERSNKIMIIGDWNARVGSNINTGLGSLGQFGEKIQNRNGRRMTEFCIANDLIVGNTFWYQPLEEKYTYEADERGARSLIDYVVYTRELEQKIDEVKTIGEAELSTQHRLVRALINDMNITEEKKKEYERIPVYKLKDTNRAEKYKNNIDTELEKFELKRKEGTVEEVWKIFKETLIKNARQICGVKKFKQDTKRTRWWNEGVKRTIREKKKAWKKYIYTKNHEDKEEYIRKRNKAKIDIRKAKTQCWEEFGRELDELYTKNNKHFWGIVKKLRGNKGNEVRGIRNKNNELKTETTEILQVWKEYYEEKFEENRNQQEEQDEYEDTDEEQQENAIEIEMKDVEEAIGTLKLGKAGGADGVEAEMIKVMGPKGKRWIHEIFKKAWREERIPEDWENNIIIPIYKKGETGKCENYRAICLSSTVFKMYTKILQKKLIHYIGHKLADEQAAYRQGKQTTDNIHIIRNITERTIEKGGELFVTLIDLKAAFDNINRSHIWRYLLELQAPRKLIRNIKNMYQNVKGRVQMNGESSDTFFMTKGIKQGDSLSPLLFITVMDKILLNTRTKTQHLQSQIGHYQLRPIKVDNLMYADDIILIADTHKKMKGLVKIWSEEIENMGMEVNTNKTKMMIINNKESELVRKIEINGNTIEAVTAVEYLGSVITDDGRIEVDIANRMKKTRNIYYAINKPILQKQEIDKQVKLKVYNIIARPTLTYGSETWTINKKHESKINAGEMQFLRRIEGKTKWDRETNESIRHTLRQEGIMDFIERKQLRWYGHIIRKDEQSLLKKITESTGGRKRKRGRPRKRWTQRIEEIGTKRGKTLAEMKRMSKNRKEWKDWTSYPTP